MVTHISFQCDGVLTPDECEAIAYRLRTHPHVVRVTTLLDYDWIRDNLGKYVVEKECSMTGLPYLATSHQYVVFTLAQGGYLYMFAHSCDADTVCRELAATHGVDRNPIKNTVYTWTRDVAYDDNKHISFWDGVKRLFMRGAALP